SAVLASGRDGGGERLGGVFLMGWGSPAGAGAGAVIRSAGSNEAVARVLRGVVTRGSLRRPAKELGLGPQEASARTRLAATQLAGLIMTRYVVRLEAVVNTPAPVLVAMVGPTIQRYLTGPLPAGATDGGAEESRA